MGDIDMMNFDKIISDYVRKKQEEDKKEFIIGKYSASMLGSCLRKTYYTYIYPTELDEGKLKIFETGKIIHEWIVNLLSNTPHAELAANEKELAIVDTIGNLMISGRLDDLIVVKKNGMVLEDNIDLVKMKDATEKIIVEVKSARSLDYINSPKAPHMMQLMIYLKNMSYYGIKKGVLLYVDKNNLKTKSFETGFREDIFNEALERARILNKHLILKTLPLAEGKINKEQEFECRYCEHKKQCDKDCLNNL
jgi:hypothetical protein